jgi:hypothetical protein
MARATTKEVVWMI